MIATDIGDVTRLRNDCEEDLKNAQTAKTQAKARLDEATAEVHNLTAKLENKK